LVNSWGTNREQSGERPIRRVRRLDSKANMVRRDWAMGTVLQRFLTDSTGLGLRRLGATPIAKREALAWYLVVCVRLTPYDTRASERKRRRETKRALQSLGERVCGCACFFVFAEGGNARHPPGSEGVLKRQGNGRCETPPTCRFEGRRFVVEWALQQKQNQGRRSTPGLLHVASRGSPEPAC